MDEKRSVTLDDVTVRNPTRSELCSAPFVGHEAAAKTKTNLLTLTRAKIIAFDYFVEKRITQNFNIETLESKMTNDPPRVRNPSTLFA